MFEINETELTELRKHCKVRKHNPFGLSPKEYERGVFLVEGTIGYLNTILRCNRDHPIKIKVILEEKN